MRVIIKPGGLIALMLAITSLVIAVIVSQQNGRKNANPSPTLSAPVKTAGTPGTTAVNSKNLLRENGWQHYMEETAVLAFSPIGPPDAPATPSYHFTIERLGKKSWNAGFINKLTEATLSPGEKLRVQFWAKSTGNNPIIVLLQRDAPPFPHVWKEHVTLTTQWKKYEYTFALTPEQRFGPGESVFAIQMGEATGSVDLAGITLERP